MLIIGLTGSIGMGKSTTAAMFRDEGLPVHDSDATVHRLYAGSGAVEIAKHFPDAVSGGSVDRAKLASIVLPSPENMRLLESIIHPLVEQSRQEFVARCTSEGRRFCMVDIPLLFEIGGENLADVIVVVSASDAVQEARVLARPGMTREKFLAIRTKQIPNAEKRRRAHWVIDTGAGMAAARRQVRELLRALAQLEK